MVFSSIIFGNFKEGDIFGYFISKLIKKNFGLNKQPLVDVQTNILLVWIIVFLIVFASIPLGLAVGLATVLLTNLLEITQLSLYPEVSPAAKAVGSVWIVVFIFYFAALAARASGKNGDTATGLGKFFTKPFLFVIAYFALLIAAGIFIRF